MSTAERPARPLRAFAVYNVARLGLFAAFVGILYLGGFRSYLLLLLALAFSGVVSWFVLAPLRVSVARGIEGSVVGLRSRMAARTQAEDRAAEEFHAAQARPPAADEGTATVADR